jgi:hypothetical protein
MNDNAAAEIKRLFLENAEFRKEFITNTKAILERYGINIGDETPIEFQQTGKPGEIKPMKCIIVESLTTKGFLICDF